MYRCIFITYSLNRARMSAHLPEGLENSILEKLCAKFMILFLSSLTEEMLLLIELYYYLAGSRRKRVIVLCS